MRFIIIAILIALLGGCTHTRVFDLTTSEDRARVNAQVEQRSSVVLLRSGERADAKALQLNSNAASWINPETGEPRSVLLTEIRAVEMPAYGRGALEGLAIGTGIGGLLGFIGITIEGAEEQLGGPSTEVVLLGSAFLGGLVGALVGIEAGRTLYVSKSPLMDVGVLPVKSQPDSLKWRPLPRLLLWEPTADKD